MMMHSTNQQKHKIADDLTTHTQFLNALKNEAHVCLAFVERHSDPKLLAWYRDLLSEEEREKHKNFYFVRDRDLYLLTHGLVRTTLSKYLKIDPGKLVFTNTGYGRPEIAQSEGDPQIRFSVSRSHGLVACLIVLSIDAGVDVERIRKLDNLKTLSEDVFTYLEISRFRDLSENDQMEGFFTLWTLKEAYIKARGIGFSLPLNRFSFYFDAARCIRIFVSPELQDTPSNWQFASYRPKRSHTIAVALRRKDRPDLRIRFFEAIPELNSISFQDLRQRPLENLKGLTLNS